MSRVSVLGDNYNFSATDFTPADVYSSIKEYLNSSGKKNYISLSSSLCCIFISCICVRKVNVSEHDYVLQMAVPAAITPQTLF